MGVEKEIKNSINNFTTFRPEIKDVKIKKMKLICDIYHVYGIRVWYKPYPNRYFKGQEIINHKEISSLS